MQKQDLDVVSEPVVVRENPVINDFLRMPVMLAATFLGKVRLLLLLGILNASWIIYFVTQSSEYAWLWLIGLSFLYVPVIIHQGLLYHSLRVILKMQDNFDKISREALASLEELFRQNADYLNGMSSGPFGMHNGFASMGKFRSINNMSSDLSEVISPITRALLLANPLFMIIVFLLVFITTLITIFTFLAYL